MARWIAALLALFAAPAAAQSFNVDIGANAVYPAPAASYGAAAGQPGHWNVWSGSAPVPLTAIDGAPTAAWAQYLVLFGTWTDVETNLGGSSGDDELLMDDRRTAGTVFGSLEHLEIFGLWPGRYEVYTYCFDGNPGNTVRVLESPDPPATLSGGTFPGMQVEGVTYARHQVLVDDGVITIRFDNLSWPSTINGFQLRWSPLGAEAYCTAGTSASGCAAAIGVSGSPSASAPSGFWLSATGVEGAKDGLFFFGTNGKQASPWGNGTSYQCVVPPVVRGGLLQGSGTSGACDGAFGQDFNALWTAFPAKNPGAGATVQAQLWYRDPQSTSSMPTSLSDAVELTVGY